MFIFIFALINPLSFSFWFVCSTVLLVKGASVNLPLGSTHCHLYSSQECEKDGTKCGNTTEECDNKEAEIPSCYVLWKNETSSGGGVDVSENLFWAGGRCCVIDGVLVWHVSCNNCYVVNILHKGLKLTSAKKACRKLTKFSPQILDQTLCLKLTLTLILT